MSDTVELSSDVNAEVRDVIERAIENGTEIGVQCTAYLHDKMIVNVSAGLADETSGRKVTDDTLFHVYSVTKAVLATTLHIQAERGLIDYGARVAD